MDVKDKMKMPMFMTTGHYIKQYIIEIVKNKATNLDMVNLLIWDNDLHFKFPLQKLGFLVKAYVKGSNQKLYLSR